MHCILLFSDQNLLPKLQVDKGAIKFILSGANIMAPGLTSPGARMDIDLPADTVVVSEHTRIKCRVYFSHSISTYFTNYQ